MEAYAADKARVYARARRAAVYNVADAATLAMVKGADVAKAAPNCRARANGCQFQLADACDRVQTHHI